MAETKKMVLDIDASKSSKSVKELRLEIKAIQDQMVNLEEGSDAFLELANKAGEAKHQIDEIQRATRAASADFGDLMVHTTKIGASMIGSFQAVKGAMTLLGVESENVEKAILKMQASMAVVQGLQSIDAGVKSFKTLTTAIKGATAGLSGFRKALIATGIGAFVAILSELIVRWDDITEALKKYGIISEDTTAKEKELANAMQEHAKTLHQLEDDYEAWTRKNKVAEMNEESRKSYQKLTTQIEDYEKQLDIIVKKQQDPAISRESWEQLNQQGIQLGENIKLLKDQQDAIVNNAKSYVTLTKELTKATEELKKPEKLVVEDLKEEEKLRKKNLDLANQIIDSKKTDIDIINEQIAQLKAAMQLDFENRSTYLTAITDLELQLHKIKMDNQAEEALAAEEAYQRELDQYTILFSNFANNLDLISENQAWGKIVDNISFLTANWALLNEGIEKGGKEAASAYMTIFSQAFGAIGNLMTGLANEQDASNKDGFEKQKKFLIAATVMNMLSGIASAWASAMQLGPIAGPIAGAILTAATSALGGVQIAKIKQTKYEGGSQSLSSPSVNTNALQSAIQPVQYTQDVQGASIEQGIKDTRVYVVESDITNTQNKVLTAESENRF